MPEKPIFKTGTTGPEFINESKPANIDNEVLPKMVNAKVAENRESAYGRNFKDNKS